MSKEPKSCNMAYESAWRGCKELHFVFNLGVMVIIVDVTLISGQRVSLEADITASLQSLEDRGRRTLGVGRGRLFSSSGSMLDRDTKLGDGSAVTWGAEDHGGDSNSVQEQLKNVQQIQASGSAFAAILADGSVVTGGQEDHGGDSNSVKKQL